MLRVRGGVPRRVGIRGHKPSPAGVLELLKRQLSGRGAVLPCEPQRKVWLFVSSGRSPGGVGLRRRETTPGRCRSLGDFSRVLFLAGCGCTKVNEEQRLRTSQRGGAGMPKPAGRRQPNCWAGEREGKQSLLNESLQLLDGLMSVSDRLSGATLSPPDAVPRALGARSEVSLRLQRVRPQARQLVEMHQSV